MSLSKKIFGYFLILFSLLVVLMIGLPQVFSSSNSGRIDKEISVNVDFLQNENTDIVLLYFGYAGCGTICIPSLSEISTIFSKVNNRKNVSIYFVNLLNSVDPKLPQLFASSFNKDFKGIYLDPEKLKSVTSIFNVTYSKALMNNSELNHTGYLYLLEKDKITKQYNQKYIYTTRPFVMDLIVEDINQLLQKKD